MSSGYPGAEQITVHFEFPNRDPKATPHVTNSTSEADEITDDKVGIYWASTSNLGWEHDDGLMLTGVTLYSDAAKTQPVSPPYLRDGGQNFGRLNWIILFNGVEVDSEQTLYYDLHFKDNDFSDLDWDPTLKIKPRSGTAPPPSEAVTGS